jgi:hypothetical protein
LLRFVPSTRTELVALDVFYRALDAGEGSDARYGQADRTVACADTPVSILRPVASGWQARRVSRLRTRWPAMTAEPERRLP